MTKKENAALIGGSIGLLAGGLLMCTDKGKEINKNMKEAFDLFDEKVSKYLTTKKNEKEADEDKADNTFQNNGNVVYTANGQPLIF